MSYRADIADAIKTQLSGQTAAADESIFTCLERPLTPTDLPAIVIYTMASRRGDNTTGSTTIPRVVSVVIEAAVSSTPAGAMTAAEDLADAIESTMNADRTLGNLVEDCEWQETITDVTSEGDYTLGIVLLQYQVKMATNLAADSVYEFLDDGMEDAPIPTEVFTNPVPVADAYAPEIVDDIAAVVAVPPGQTESACEDGSCDIDAFQGDPPFDVFDDSFDDSFG